MPFLRLSSRRLEPPSGCRTRDFGPRSAKMAGSPQRSAILVLIAILTSACQTTGARFPNADVVGSTEPQRQISGTLAKPDGDGPFPAVVLLHTCGGVQPHVRDDWPSYLTKSGYVTITVDSFGSRGLGPCPNFLHTADVGPKTNAYREITRDAFGALEYLSTLPYVDSSRIAVIGFSLGANTINSFLIHQPKRPGRNFAAAVGVYGRCHDLPSHPRPQTPLMEIAGELDGPHVESCRRVASMVEVHILPGAHHAWDSPSAHNGLGQAGELMRYDAASTERSRELVRDFFARHLKKDG